MKTAQERIDAIKHELRYNSGPAIPYIRISTQDARMLVCMAEENERLRAEHDALISKIADMRTTLFTDAEFDYYGLIHSPEFVLDAINDKMPRLRKALEFYGNEFNYAFMADDIRKDYGKRAREALEIGEESNAL